MELVLSILLFAGRDRDRLHKENCFDTIVEGYCVCLEPDGFLEIIKALIIDVAVLHKWSCVEQEIEVHNLWSTVHERWRVLWSGVDKRRSTY